LTCKIGPGKVAFVSVDGFKGGPRKARPVAGAQPASVQGGPGRVGNGPKGIIAAFVVYISVGRINMENIGIHGGLVVEPATGP